MKRIIAITMVKNEQDIIESFVRHTLSFADELLVCDHQSTDATREILEKLKEEGLPIEVRTEYRAAHVQEEVMSGLLHEAVEEHSADLVVPLDADEFLIPLNPGDIRNVLETLSLDQVYAVSMRTTVPVGGTEKDFLLYRPLRWGRKLDKSIKCIVGGRTARRDRLRLVEGNHYAYRSDDPHRWSVSTKPCSLCLAHFYWRSAEQYRSKAVVGWWNIAAQFSADAILGGGYREISAKVAAGEMTTWHDILPESEPADLHGYAKEQSLCYSDNVHPNAFQNIIAAGNVLAESYAVLRAENQQMRVTSVVPFLGEEEPFRKSLASVCAEVYPRHEILVPVIAGLLSAEIMKPFMWLVAAGKLSIVGDARTSIRGGIFEALQNRATGDFIEWVLPGETVAPQKLRAMTTSCLLQNDSLAFCISGAPENGQDMASPYRSLGVAPLENIRRMTKAACYRWMLRYGAVPHGGMSALLLRRKHMDACHWLRGCFEGAYPVLLSMFRVLLLGKGTEGEVFVGAFSGCYHGEPSVPPLEERAMHQLVWGILLQKDEQNLPASQRNEAHDRFRRNGIALLTEAIETGADTSSLIWQQYQSMLRDA